MEKYSTEPDVFKDIKVIKLNIEQKGINALASIFPDHPMPSRESFYDWSQGKKNEIDALLRGAFKKAGLNENEISDATERLRALIKEQGPIGFKLTFVSTALSSPRWDSLNVLERTSLVLEQSEGNSRWLSSNIPKWESRKLLSQSRIYEAGKESHTHGDLLFEVKTADVKEYSDAMCEGTVAVFAKSHKMEAQVAKSEREYEKNYISVFGSLPKPASSYILASIPVQQSIDQMANVQDAASRQQQDYTKKSEELAKVLEDYLYKYRNA